MRLFGVDGHECTYINAQVLLHQTISGLIYFKTLDVVISLVFTPVLLSDYTGLQYDLMHHAALCQPAGLNPLAFSPPKDKQSIRSFPRQRSSHDRSSSDQNSNRAAETRSRNEFI